MAETKKTNNLDLFLKKNQRKPKNIFVPATRSLVDEDGEPLLWEVKAITTKEDAALAEESMKALPDGSETLDKELYIYKFAAACTAYPDLYSKTLQDSYGVHTPEDLISEMLCNTAEFNAYYERCKAHSGADMTFEDEVAEAKNS